MKFPPRNLEAEQAVIGSMLLDPACLVEVSSILEAGDFHGDAHQVLYRAILSLHDDGRPFDAVTLIDELSRVGRLEKAGGEEVIRKALEQTPHAANAAYYAQIVRQRSVARRVVEAAHETLREGYSDGFTADELVDRAERRFFAIGQGRLREEAVPIGDLVRRAMLRIAERAEGFAASGLGTGYGDLDDLTGGLSPGNLVVLAARPGMGKTALALGIADHVAGSLDVGTLFVSLEMAGGELAERVLSARSGVPSTKIKAARFLSDEGRRSLDEAAPLIEGLPLWVDDSASLTPSQISASARRFKARHDIGLLVVDYLQIVVPEDDRQPRQEQVAGASRRFKALAKEIGCPVLVLAQLNRQPEQRADRRPVLSDLRESGQIEQDADLVILLHRPEYYDPIDKPGIAELIVAKNRNGATAKLDLVFEKELMRFSDVEHRYQGFF